MWASSLNVRSSNRNHSINSNKFIVSCQDRITPASPTTNEWLTVIGSLKKTNQRDLSRVLKGILERRNMVAIKISSSQTLHKEYVISSLLKDIPGFMQPYCFFQCNDEFTEHPSQRSSLCKGPGTSMNILVMPYLEEGSMREFNWLINPALLHSCLMQFVCSLMQAYESKGIIHSDTHLDNVLLKKTSRSEVEYRLNNNIVRIPTNGYLIVIMDFEMSFNEVASNRGRSIDQVYNDLLHGIYDLQFESYVKITNDTLLVNTLMELKLRPVSVYDGFKILKPLIELITVSPKQLQSFVYDPSVYG
jgi:serine/threonine protein kinase